MSSAPEPLGQARHLPQTHDAEDLPKSSAASEIISYL